MDNYDIVVPSASSQMQHCEGEPYKFSAVASITGGVCGTIIAVTGFLFNFLTACALLRQALTEFANVQYSSLLHVTGISEREEI